MKIKLVMDGSIDVPVRLRDEYDIGVVNPIVIIDGVSFVSGVDITPKEFAERQATAVDLPKTSQPSPGEFAAFFERALETHDRVLYIGLSAKLSGTFNSARQGAQTLDGERVVLYDSHSISGAAGFQVIAAARALAAGGGIEEALAAARRARDETLLLVSVDDLNYLVRGGRVGRLSGAIGSLLQIRPILRQNATTGEMLPIARVRSFRSAVRRMVEMATDHVGAGAPARLMIIMGMADEETARMEKGIREAVDPVWFEKVTAAPTLLAHTGPQALGIVAAPGDWP